MRFRSSKELLISTRYKRALAQGTAMRFSFIRGRLEPVRIYATEVEPRPNSYERTYRNVTGIQNERRMIFSISGIILVVICLAFQSCDRDKNNPGYDYFPDMAYSKAYETYAPNPNAPDGKTLMAPVEGTVSREAVLYPYKKTDADLLKAAKMTNPFMPDTENINRGKIVYQNICLQCHGIKADGKGHLFTSGKYPYPPANLVSQKTINRTDGEIFHIITVGFGIMPPHDIIVRPDDRWKAVLYVRSLQGKKN